MREQEKRSGGEVRVIERNIAKLFRCKLCSSVFASDSDACISWHRDAYDTISANHRCGGEYMGCVGYSVFVGSIDRNIATDKTTEPDWKFFCESCGELFLSGTTATECSDCGGKISKIQETSECGQDQTEMTHSDCLEWVQSIIWKIGGKPGTIDEWAEAISESLAGRSPSNPLEAWFFGSIQVGLLGLHAISGYDGEIEVNLDKAIEIMRSYYSYHSEENAIGPLMMAIGIVVEDAVLGLEHEEQAWFNDRVDALGAIMAQCKAWKKSACAIGTPAIVPSAPASGGGTGPSMPPRITESAEAVTSYVVQCHECKTEYGMAYAARAGKCECGAELMKGKKKRWL